MSNLPYRCEKHPNSPIRHEFNENRYYAFGRLTDIKDTSDHRYFCNVCGLEVSAPRPEHSNVIQDKQPICKGGNQ